ncbi:MAG: hypothetical protein PHX62_03310 [Bacilli bacterium]|nr:hypothetical protein [Bacilli bacterium]
MDVLGQFLPIAGAIVSLLAMIVSLITEAIKNLGFLKKVPTNIVVLILSIIICILAYLGASSYYGMKVKWYSLVGSFLGGFVVNYIATYGWEKFNALYLRFQKRKEKTNSKV